MPKRNTTEQKDLRQLTRQALKGTVTGGTIPFDTLKVSALVRIADALEKIARNLDRDVTPYAWARRRIERAEALRQLTEQAARRQRDDDRRDWILLRLIHDIPECPAAVRQVADRVAGHVAAVLSDEEARGFDVGEIPWARLTTKHAKAAATRYLTLRREHFAELAERKSR